MCQENRPFDTLEANYDPVFGLAAHTIAHREITINNNDIMGDDNYDTESFKLFDDDTVSLFNGNISTIKNDSGGSFFCSFGNSENILLSSDDNQTRQLVVVTVRGSVCQGDGSLVLINRLDSSMIFRAEYNAKTSKKALIILIKELKKIMIFQEIFQELLFQIETILKGLSMLGFIAWQIIQGLFLEIFR